MNKQELYKNIKNIKQNCLLVSNIEFYPVDDSLDFSSFVLHGKDKKNFITELESVSEQSSQ